MSFWGGRRVFLTGHTGFKGGWLSLYLHQLGATVCGYALPPEGSKHLYSAARIERVLESHFGDICDQQKLNRLLVDQQPEIIFHLAAQPLVRESYRDPVETYRVNVMGTLALLAAARTCKSVRAVVVITTDKCYDNKEWIWGYREVDRLGGFDPYSSSKACVELAVDSWRRSFFEPSKYEEHGVAIATARAGNVIGGGDWSTDRLVPDIVSSLIDGQKPVLRNPGAIRPWQHVMEPLRGYLLLAERLVVDGATFASAFNFGPELKDTKPVSWIAARIAQLWGAAPDIIIDRTAQPHEAHTLRLDCTKAASLLGWVPQISLDKALEMTTEWYRSWSQGADMHAYTLAEIGQFQNQTYSV